MTEVTRIDTEKFMEEPCFRRALCDVSPMRREKAESYRFAADISHNRVYTFRNDEENKDVYMIALRDNGGELIGYYEKHEYRTRESAQLYDMPD